jgi:hypothetical protein
MYVSEKRSAVTDRRYNLKPERKDLLAHGVAELAAGFPLLGLVPRYAGDGLAVGADVSPRGRGIGAGTTDLDEGNGQEKEQQTKAGHTDLIKHIVAHLDIRF